VPQTRLLLITVRVYNLHLLTYLFAYLLTYNHWWRVWVLSQTLSQLNAADSSLVIKVISPKCHGLRLALCLATLSTNNLLDYTDLQLRPKGWNDVIVICGHNTISMLWNNTAYCEVVKIWHVIRTRKPRKGAAVIAASMHGFASCWKFKSPVTLTLTLDRVKVTLAYTVHVGLPAGPTTWL